MRDSGAKLDAKQEEAIVALLTQRNVEEAARAVDVAPSTLFRWLKDPGFDQAYREARRLAFRQSIGRLQQGATAAATTLLKMMVDPNVPPSCRIRAADSVLAHAVKDLCELLERFDRRGVSLVSVAESLDTGSAAGRLVLNIMTAVSQWEREAIGERTRDALRHKRSLGQRTGNIPFGSRLAGDGEHLEPDPAEREALEQIRQLRNQGESMRRIAAALNHRAYRTRRGTPWRLESVARVLNQVAVAR